jgi:hypothetical protein
MVHHVLKRFKRAVIMTGDVMEMDVHRCEGPPRPAAPSSVSNSNHMEVVMGVPLLPMPLT